MYQAELQQTYGFETKAHKNDFYAIMAWVC